MNKGQKNLSLSFRLSVSITVCLLAFPSVCQRLRLSFSTSVCLSASPSVCHPLRLSFQPECLLSVSSSVCQPVIFLSALPLSVRQHHSRLSVSSPVCQPSCLSALHLTVKLSSVCLSVCSFACPSVYANSCVWSEGGTSVPDSLTNDWCQPNFLLSDKPSSTPYSQNKKPFFTRTYPYERIPYSGMLYTVAFYTVLCNNNIFLQCWRCVYFCFHLIAFRLLHLFLSFLFFGGGGGGAQLDKKKHI